MNLVGNLSYALVEVGLEEYWQSLARQCLGTQNEAERHPIQLSDILSNNNQMSYFLPQNSQVVFRCPVSILIGQILQT